MCLLVPGGGRESVHLLVREERWTDRHNGRILFPFPQGKDHEGEEPDQEVIVWALPHILSFIPAGKDHEDALPIFSREEFPQPDEGDSSL